VRPRRLPLAILTALALLTSLAFASSASADSAEITEVSAVSFASAHVKAKATIDAGFALSAQVQYSTDEANWTTGFAESLSAGAKEFEGNLTGLKGGVKYFARIQVVPIFTGSETISPKPNPSFTTLVADPPVVEQTDNATEIEYTTASVSGKVNRPTKSNSLTCNFEYLTDAAYQANPVGDRFAGASPTACEPNLVEPEGSSDVKAKLTGLTNATTYHLRLAASNASHVVTKEAASTFTTLAVDPPTVVSVEDATDVFSRSADAAGVIKRPANPDPAFDIVSCQFEYVTAAQFGATGFAGAGTAPCLEPINNGPDEETSVTANITGLDAETTYHLRLAAQNAAATPGTKEAANTFTTTAKVAAPTVLSVQNATGVDQDSAKVSGEVERPAGGDPALDVTCRAEYVTEASFQGNEEQSVRVRASAGAGTYTIGFKGESTAPIAFNASAASVKAALEGLAAIGAGDVTVRGGPGNTFAASPYLIVFVGALAGTNVEAITTDISGFPPYPPSSATVETLAEGGHAPGFVNPGRTDCDPLASEVGPQEAKVGIFGLQPDTTYHLRLTAENGGGTDTKVAASTFTTDPNLPASAVLGPITEISGWGAKLSGEADAEGFPFTYNAIFEVSTDGVTWTNPTPAGPGGSLKLQPVAPVVLTGLKGATKYFVRLHVLDGDGGFGGLNFYTKPPYPSFTTLPVDSATVLKADNATDVTVETAKVSGEIERPANPEPASDTNCRFEYVTDAQFQANGYQGARRVPCGIDSLSTPEEKKAVEAELTELRSGTKYHFRLVATNAGPDASLEAASTFTTVAVPATVTTTAGGSDNEGGYILSGLVNPHNSTISDCKFVYGPNSEVDPEKYAFAVPCSPLPSGVNERQRVQVTARIGHQFRLSFAGQTTGDIAVDAQASVVQSALESLSSIGPSAISQVTRTVAGQDREAQRYDITFSGPLAGTNVPSLQVENGSDGIVGVQVSTLTDGYANAPITVEGHVTGLTPGSEYHFRLVATNAFGRAITPDSVFVPTLAAKEPCPANEQERKENNSFALPECRAYELVTPMGKEGFGVDLDSYDGGARVAYGSQATNLVKSGQGRGVGFNLYVAARTETGWETIPDLNGSSGSFNDAPMSVDSQWGHTGIEAYSQDLLSSVWYLHRQGDPNNGLPIFQLRNPDGTFTPIGSTAHPWSGFFAGPMKTSADLSHLVTWRSQFGPGVYEYVGTGMDQPRRVDLDNSGPPISTCPTALGTAQASSLSSDGTRVVLRVFGGCGTGNPPAGEIWARVNGTTSFDVSASHCNRTAADPGGVCNGPTEPAGCVEAFNSSTGDVEGPGCRRANFAAATPDGSRVFFTTTQQLVNADTDETNDIYACDIPAGNPTPGVGKANHCAAFRQVSGAQTGADVESVDATSENGATVLFTAKGVLADNKDAFGNTAVAGDHNLYVWRTDAGHPDGQTAFVGRLYSDELKGASQSTPDGRYLVFTTATQLLDTDTDAARDVYRYDADTGTLTRVSTNVFGVAGNGEGFDAFTQGEKEPGTGSPGKVVHPAISDDGKKIVFVTEEALSAVDGNAETDVYLWTPSRVFLISTGSVGGGAATNTAITPSGQDIYFETAQALTPADGDSATDVYDARIGGGFSFPSPPVCIGEDCQGERHEPVHPKPLGSQIPGPGNPKQKPPCPKGKVGKKSGRCVKKHKKHHKKSGKGKKASHKQGGGK
jgi:hypothetical protein